MTPDEFYRGKWDNLVACGMIDDHRAFWTDGFSAVVLPVEKPIEVFYRRVDDSIGPRIAAWIAQDGPAWRVSKPWPADWQVEPGMVPCRCSAGRCECDSCGTEHRCGECEGVGTIWAYPDPSIMVPWPHFGGPAIVEWCRAQKEAPGGDFTLGWDGRRIWLAVRFLVRPLTLRELVTVSGPALVFSDGDGGAAIIMGAKRADTPVPWYLHEPEPVEMLQGVGR